MATDVALAWIAVDKDTARARLKAAGTEYAATKPTWDSIVERLNDAIEDARQAGLPQHEVVKLSGYTRETIRRRWKKQRPQDGD